MLILFVCTGNTCRSIMAEGMAQKFAQELGLGEWLFLSAGISAYPGLPASPHAISVMKDYDIDITNHESRLLTGELATNADMIIAMTRNHKESILRSMPELKNKTYTLKAFSKEAKDEDICDPYGQTIEIYRNVASEIKDCLAAFIKIKQKNN